MSLRLRAHSHSVAPFRDRVVHHAVVNVLEPIFEPVFIYDSYATRKGKGTHKAIRRAQAFLKRGHYYYKTDVAKFFDSVDHDTLLRLVQRKTKDDNVLCLVERIIRNSDISRGLSRGKGLPIGNLTSQFFANVYLDPLDHFIKDAIGVKRYIRYMDDLVVFSDSKDYLKAVMSELRAFCDRHLELSLHPNSTCLNSRMNGIPFLGFRIFPNLLRIRKENLKRTRRRIARRTEDFEKGLITETELAMSVGSMFEHLSFADSFRLRSTFV